MTVKVLVGHNISGEKIHEEIGKAIGIEVHDGHLFALTWNEGAAAVYAPGKWISAEVTERKVKEPNA
jgi:hypothetical protein